MSDLSVWTPIEYATHSKPGAWWPIEGAPMSGEAARIAYADGVVLMANRRLFDRTLLVIKRRQAPPSKGRNA